MKRFVAAAGLAALNLIVPAAHADENIFAYSYGSETLPKGKSEAYLWATDRRGKGAGDYNAQDYKLELEHGFTDRFQASVYANFSSHHVRGLEPEIEDLHRNFGWNGTQVAFKYALSSPYKDALGVAIYLEPGYARYSSRSGEREDQFTIEAKLLLQKNFMQDRLIWVGNATVEQEFAHEPGGGHEFEKELEFELSSGLAYRIAPSWYLGAEGRYTSAYENFPSEFHRADYGLFAGPTIHYGSTKWWGTLSYQPQLNGGPKVRSGNLNLADHEKREIRLKLGYNF